MNDELINIALAEVGYSTMSYSNKYAEYLDEINFYPERVNGIAYCGIFIDYCFVKAFGEKLAKQMLYRDKTVNAYEAYKLVNKLDNAPEVGSQIFFEEKGEVKHTGLVIDIIEDKITFISANNIVGNERKVMNRMINKNNPKIAGYGKPDYKAMKVFEGEEVITPPPSVENFVTDLTNTTWKWNETVSGSGFDNSHLINFVSNGQSYSAIYLGSGNLTYENSTRTEVLSGGVWEGGVNSPYRIITVTGGAEATNTDLIDYFQSNAVYQNEGQTVTINYNLTNCVKISSTVETAEGGSFTTYINADSGYVIKETDITITNGSLTSLTNINNTYKLDVTYTAAPTITIVASVDPSAVYKLRINGVLASINGKKKGTLTFEGKTYHWDNTSSDTPVTPTPTPAVSYYAMTIAGLGNSDPSTVTFTASGDQAFPTTAFPTVTQDGNDFIKVPTMYRKVDSVVDGQITSFTIANAKVDGDYVPYPCFVRADGTIAPYILIGKVQLDGADYTPADGLTQCRAKGAGYYPYDIWTHKLFQDLELAMSKKVDYNDGSDIITTATMGIEGLDYYYWIYGLIRSDGGWNVCYDPSKYVALASETAAIPSDYKKLSYAEPAADGYISKLGYDSAHPFANYPVALDSDGTDYYCDYYYYMDGNRPVYCVVSDVNVDCGLWFCNSVDGWDGGCGVRLCHRPL